MKTFTLWKTLFIAVAAAGAAWADQVRDDRGLQLTLDLLDGSHLIGAPTIRMVPVETSYARINIPLERILCIRMNEKNEGAVFELQNGDRIKGAINLEPIELETVFGKVSLGIGLIRTIGVVSGGALPAGEGTLSFGGVTWVPWRTQFEVQGDKLVSLPIVRPGFSYGHGGNGRSATVATNIGNADWKDYSVEFDYGMTGVNPALNPHQLPLDYRGGSILFHVADAKESWNEKGWSSYGLNFSGDGSWSLSCAYNSYCKTASGFGDPVSEGNRALAEGKGLNHDPLSGNKIRIDVIGTRIQIWVDGTKIADIRDEKMGEPMGGQTLDHGGIGFTWDYECMGWISNFSAKRL